MIYIGLLLKMVSYDIIIFLLIIFKLKLLFEISLYMNS